VETLLAVLNFCVANRLLRSLKVSFL